jgi:hypothetical protein
MTSNGHYYDLQNGAEPAVARGKEAYTQQQIVNAVFAANNQTRARLALIFSEDKEEELVKADRTLQTELGFTDPLDLTAIAGGRAAIIAGYKEGGAEIKECLDKIPDIVEKLEKKLTDLRDYSQKKFGSSFAATTTNTQGAATVQPFANNGLPYRYNNTFSTTFPELSQTSTELKQTPGHSSDRNKAYYLDIAAADRDTLKYPNYPILSVTGTVGSVPAGYNLAKEYFEGGQKATKLSGTKRVYPVGWATALASAFSNASAALEQLRNSPTYSEHQADEMESNYQTLLANAYALVDTGADSLSDEENWALAISSTSDRKVSDVWPETNGYAFGLRQDLTQLLKVNLKNAKNSFKTAGQSNASRDMGKIVDKLGEIRNDLRHYLLCQIVALAKDDILDKRVGELVGGKGFGFSGQNDFAAVKEAHVRTRALVLDNILDEFASRQISAEAENIEETRDKRVVLFREQCFLLNYIDVFLKRKLKEDVMEKKKTLPYVQPAGYATAVPNASTIATNSSLLLAGDPYGFINKLTLNPRLGELVNISNADLSLLQPSIRLYKIVYDEYGNDDYQVEMKFDTHMTQKALTMFGSDLGARGVGVGIKNFVFSYEGSNPFAIKKSIKANLKIFASNFRELLKERDGRSMSLEDSSVTGTRRYKYVDLALKTGRANHTSSPASGDCSTVDLMEQNENLADLNFRLRAEVGWAPVEGTEASLSADLKKAIQSSYVTLNLTPTVHNFDIDETGQVILNINYLAYIEEFFDNKNFNIFANAITPRSGNLATVENLKRSLALEEIARKCKDSNVAAEVKEDFKTRVAEDSRVAMQNLMTQLIQRNQIHYLNMPYDELKEYLLRNDANSLAKVTALVNNNASLTEAQLNSSLGRALSEFEKQKTAENQGDDEPAQDAIAAALLAGEQSGAVVSYFYLGRLVDVILEQIDLELETLGNTPYLTSDAAMASIGLPSGEAIILEPSTRRKKKREFEIAYENFKRLRILLGPVEFANSPSSRQVVVTNATFGDIPVSVKYFMEFLTEKMLKKEETFYSLTKFLNDVMNEFVRDFLNNRDCFRNMKTKVRAQQASLTSWSPDKEHDVLTLKTAQMGLAESVFKREVVNGKATLTVDSDKLAATDMFRAHLDDVSSRLKDHPILYLSGPPGARVAISPDHEFNYFVYFAGQVQPLDKMKGNRTADEERGIFHYMLGRDRGLIKNISLKKTQTKGLAEVRFEQDGYDGLRQLRVVYDVEIDSFSNINTYPGTYIYVDPAGFDPGYNVDAIKLTELGIGGYYMIIRSEHDYGPGKANSRIIAKWVNQVEAEAAQNECQTLQEQGSGTADRNEDVCGKYAKTREDAAQTTSSPGNILQRGYRWTKSKAKAVGGWFKSLI